MAKSVTQEILNPRLVPELVEYALQVNPESIERDSAYQIFFR